VAALVEQRRLRRVQVLGRIVAERAATKADHTPAGVADREGDAVAEAVINTIRSRALLVRSSAAVLLDQQAGVDRVARVLQEAGQTVPAVRREADAEALRGVAGDAAFLQVLDRRWRFAQTLAEEALCGGERIERAIHDHARILPSLSRDLDAGALRQVLDRFDEAQAVVLHQKADRVAVPA